MMCSPRCYMMANDRLYHDFCSWLCRCMKDTGGVESLVSALSTSIGDNKPLAALLMLVVGLLVTMGIGSSFSTIPIIATIYVPLCIAFGFSPMANVQHSLVLLLHWVMRAHQLLIQPWPNPLVQNADGQHEHIWETVVPTFLHYNLPLVAFGLDCGNGAFNPFAFNPAY